MLDFSNSGATSIGVCDRRVLRALAVLAAMGATGLTLQILAAHNLTGRDTPFSSAMSWALATTGAWSLAALAVLWPSSAAFNRIHSVGVRAGALLVVSVTCVLVAAVLRAAFDVLLPEAARQGAAGTELVMRFALRWSGPGMLLALVIVSIPWLAGRLRGAGVAPSREPEVESRVRQALHPDSALLESIVVRLGDRSIPVSMADVSWIAAAGNYAELHGRKGRHLARITMTELERRLDPAQFVRVHRSSIVALTAIREVRRDAAGTTEVVLLDGQVLPLSRMGRKALESRLGRKA